MRTVLSLSSRQGARYHAPKRGSTSGGTLPDFRKACGRLDLFGGASDPGDRELLDPEDAQAVLEAADGETHPEVGELGVEEIPAVARAAEPAAHHLVNRELPL